MFRYSLQVIVFLIGIVVMSVQLLTGRILAPLFGDTVLVWGSIIGVMILAMSMGYWFGGLLADKYDAKKLLFYSTLLLATSVIAMYLLKEIAYSHPLLAAIAITFLPGLFSGATMPFALKINTKQLSKIGHSYGSLSAA